MPKNPYKHDGAAGSDWVAACAQRIVWVREICAGSQVAAYTMLGIDQSTWSLMEKGGRALSITNALRMCETWGVSLDFLYRGVIGSGMRRDVELRLVAAHPELVLGLDLGTAGHAMVAGRATSDAS